ncbi:methyltransferase domain-containing protein [Streptomyces sp. 8N706]|uniref:methyltransferase domain-containing protein n=1 Tax=Streptomyces sp. 8N706 TaxID=3457416 RepID=UPI003FD068D3
MRSAVNWLSAAVGTLTDVGCGPGTFARMPAGHSSRVVAVDPDPAVIERGRELAEAAGICNISRRTLPARTSRSRQENSPPAFATSLFTGWSAPTGRLPAA